MQTNKKIYFASDFHLGVPTFEKSLEREKLIVKWLEEIKHDAEAVFLVGDVFDMWYEYKTAVPRGFTRLLGKIAELTDSGIEVHLFTGNHDMWCFDYLPQELGVKLYREPVDFTFNGKQFHIGHGDGLGPGDHGYKFIKKVFSNPVCIWLFARLHPNFGLGIANFWSRRSRIATGNTDDNYLGEDEEWLVQYCKEKIQEKDYQYLIFGHRHLPLDVTLANKGRYVNLGDWIKYFTYAVFDGEDLSLLQYPENTPHIPANLAKKNA